MNAAVAQTNMRGWHLKDKEADGYRGISLEKAYELLISKHRRSKSIIVAVIDSGIDTLHEDLKTILWNNPREIPGNGIDDDHNGYVDDVHGWNFLGGKDGRNVIDDSKEDARIYFQYKRLYQNVTGNDFMTSSNKNQYAEWKRAAQSIEAGIMPPATIENLQAAFVKLQQADSILRDRLKLVNFTGSQLDSVQVTGSEVASAKAYYLGLTKANHSLNTSDQDFMRGFENFINAQKKSAANLNEEPLPVRVQLTGDNEDDIMDKYYGNNDIMTSDGFHGTHVAGIIAADRTNHIGMEGVADNVMIMMLRAVPNGDEHDKDIALAIRYAADNGAKIINMSFGKGFSPHKEWIDEAVQYAIKHDVLFVQAAGNDNNNIDTTYNFPNPLYKNGQQANNWITVGASGDEALGGIKAGFSNYGKQRVDVFAPGVQIYSSVPGGNKYMDEQGTSMASPVVAGLAALLRSYYPTLTAAKTKYVIEQSAVRPQGFDLGRYCRTGGIVNAYQAVLLAEKIVHK